MEGHFTPANGAVWQSGEPSLPLAVVHERTSHLLHTVRLVLRTMLRAKDEAQLLRELCSTIVEEGCFEHAGIAYAVHDGSRRILWAEWVSMHGNAVVPVDVTTLNDAELTWDGGVAGHTAVGIAMQTRLPCIRQAVRSPESSGPEYRALHQHAELGDISAMTAFPMQDGDRLLGALFVASPKPGAIEEDAITFLSTLANDLAYGILTIRLRERHDAAMRTIGHLAFHDAHTDLPNRNRHLILLQQAINVAQARGEPLAVLHLRIERLHEISGVLGFQAAQDVVAEVASRLRTCIQGKHPLARVCEAIFAVILPEHTADIATEYALALLDAVRAPLEVQGVRIEATLKAGIAMQSRPPCDARTLDRCAEAALHQADSGIAIYSGSKAEENAASLALMGDLQRAIENNELHLYCQPKVDMRSSTVVGAEALVRWMHPVHGVISPARFIKLAEESGVISSLTAWLLHAAFRELRGWRDAGIDHQLAINLSAHDLRDPHLVHRIDSLLMSWGINPARVHFELTESGLIEDPAAAQQTLEHLKGLGVELAIDDFGTGFSGMSYLQKFPVDGIKIDQSFVMPMMSSPSSAAIVRSTIDLGHQLGRKVIAEGVETQAVWQCLAAEGCDIAQGYLISRPMPVADFPDWVRRWDSGERPHATSRPGGTLRSADLTAP